MANVYSEEEKQNHLDQYKASGKTNYEDGRTVIYAKQKQNMQGNIQYQKQHLGLGLRKKCLQHMEC